MAQYNIDPFGKLLETQRWIANDKLNRQQIAKQNALQDIQTQNAQIGLRQAQRGEQFQNALSTNPQQAQTDYPLLYAKAFPTDYATGTWQEGGDTVSGYWPKNNPAKRTELSRGPKSSSSTEITLNTGGDTKKFNETIDTNAANRRNQYITEATMANDARSSYDLQRSTIKSGFETGKLAPFVNSVSSFVEGFGIDPTKISLPDPSKGQVFDTATFGQLLKALAAQKGPQTEGDAQRALKTFGKMENTTEANLFILDYLEEIANRTEGRVNFINDFMDKHPEGETRRNFEKAENAYRGYLKKIPAIATGSKGMPITYGQYKRAWEASGGDMSIVDQKWRQFAAQGKY